MENNASNINKTNNQLSPQTIEHKRNITYDLGNPGTGFGTDTKMWRGFVYHYVSKRDRL